MSMTPEQKIQFESQGFLHLPRAIDPPLLGRLRLGFDAAAARTAATHKGEPPRFYDIPQPLDQDDVFVDLLDAPGVFPVLREILGEDIALLQTQARVFPPGKTFTAPWHSDLEYINGIDIAHSTNFMIKAHYYPEDLHPDQGCLAFIPGSHRYPPGQPRPQIDHLKSSPATVRIVPKAGDVVLFNVHLMHMALDNLTPHTRKSLIYAWSHFWVKNYPSAVPSEIDRLANTPIRRQLFGIPTSSEEGAYFEQTLTPRKPAPRDGVPRLRTWRDMMAKVGIR